MDASETLKRAWAVVQEADLPEALQAVAFTEAVRLLAPASAVTTPPIPSAPPMRQPPAGSPTGASIGASGDKITEDEGTILTRVATQTQVDRSKLEQIVHLDDGAIRVSIPGIKLGKNNAEKVRAIAQIITIVRGFGLDETETSVEFVRAEAQRLKCYDQANFSSQLRILDGYLLTGPTTSRRIRAKAAGIQAFPALVNKLLGAE